MALFDLEEIKKRFYPVSFHRGLLYASEGRVFDIDWNPLTNTVKADVQGTHKTPYFVMVNIETDQNKVHFIGSCTCPLGHECKHIVAVLIKAQELLNLEESIFLKESILDFGLSQWLKLFQKKKPILHSGNEKILIYILTGFTNTSSFSVVPISTSVLKSGHFSSSYNRYIQENSYSLNHPKFVQENDIPILRLIKALSKDYSYSETYKIIESEENLLLLKFIIQSKRCYLSTYEHPQAFLTFGEEKRGTISWEIDSEGVQRITADVPDIKSPILLSTQPLHYICPATKKIGILTTNLSSQLAAIMIKAPEVKPTQAKLFRDSLAHNFPTEVSGVLPKELSVQKTILEPTPCLTLKTILIKSKSWSDSSFGIAIPVSVIIVSAQYGEKEIPIYSKNTTLSSLEKNEVMVIPRDPRKEQAIINTIPTMGFITTLKNLERFYTINEPVDSAVSESTFSFAQAKRDSHKEKQIVTKWETFIKSKIPELQKKGWIIKYDRSFEFTVLQADEEWHAEIEEEKGNDWFGISLGVTVEGERINLIPILLKLLRTEETLLKTIENLPKKEPFIVTLKDGRKLALPSQRVKILLKTLQHLFSYKESIDSDFIKLQALDAALLAEIKASSDALNMRWFGGDKTLALGNRLKNFSEVKFVTLPKIFKGDLRHYQLEGLNWLQFLREYGLAGILADDMGLGKTVQMLAHIALEKSEKRLKKPVLVVAPTSLMVNWKMEAEKFVPSLKVLTLHGPNRKAHFNTFSKYDLILTTYPLLPRDKEVLLSCDYHTVVLDEAQTIKNSRAKLTQIANQLKADHRLCMTGTPMENHLGELWSLFNFLLPGYLGTLKEFGPFSQNTLLLSKRIKPFILRRTKQEVVTELPPKTEMIRRVELEGTQRDLYETIRISMQEKVRKEIASRGMDKSHIIVLDALLKLRQICCDPSLLKLESAKKVSESAKLDELLTMLVPMIEEGRKILLFSQFTSMLSIIEKALKKLDIPYVILTGKTVDRETPVRSFQSGKVSLFLISLKAGGTGLNLTAADTVIHYDPWWNPAVENQATDRAYRIGQDKPVFVYKLITSGTVEEKIIEMQQKKHKLMESLFDPKEKSSGKLTASDLQTLFEPISKE